MAMIPSLIRRILKTRYAKYLMQSRGHLRGPDAMPLRTRNDVRNRKLFFDKDGYLTDQAAGIEGRYRYGVTKTADTGCEIIAVYNLLLKYGKKRDLRELVRRFDSAAGGRVLLGMFGTSIRGMQRILTEEGVPVRCLKGDELDEMDKADAGILSFWWSESSFHIHTVMIEKESRGGIVAYNFDPWHGMYQIRERSVSDLIKHRGIRPIAFLAVETSGKNRS